MHILAQNGPLVMTGDSFVDLSYGLEVSKSVEPLCSNGF